ncbi:unnamed protein product [Calypogeia fissa]
MRSIAKGSRPTVDRNENISDQDEEANEEIGEDDEDTSGEDQDAPIAQADAAKDCNELDWDLEEELDEDFTADAMAARKDSYISNEEDAQTMVGGQEAMLQLVGSSNPSLPTVGARQRWSSSSSYGGRLSAAAIGGNVGLQVSAAFAQSEGSGRGQYWSSSLSYVGSSKTRPCTREGSRGVGGELSGQSGGPWEVHHWKEVGGSKSVRAVGRRHQARPNTAAQGEGGQPTHLSRSYPKPLWGSDRGKTSDLDEAGDGSRSALGL